MQLSSIDIYWKFFVYDMYGFCDFIFQNRIYPIYELSTKQVEKRCFVNSYVNATVEQVPESFHPYNQRAFRIFEFVFKLGGL